MRPFSEFHVEADATTISRARAAEARSLATWAYLLLRPGMEFVRQRSNFILGWQAAAAAGASLNSGVSAGAVGSADRPPLGSWMILPDLAGPATRTVLPSTDALYGAAHVELDRLGPVVLTVPANVDERYYSVAIMDAHMNNVAHIGPRWTGNAAGTFLVVPPDWSGEAPDNMPVIASSTVSITLYNRMLVMFEDGDIDRVRAWQSGLRITQLRHWPDADAVPDTVDTADLVHPDINTLTSAQEYLRIGLAHLERNPLVREAQWLSHLVEHAWLTDAANEAAVEAGADDATTLIDTMLATWPRVNGWMVPDAALGRPNPHVLRSAAFQQFQIGSNDIDESIYSFVDTDADDSLLDASDGARYEITFTAAELPAYHASGYWSLTLYDGESLLVPNPIDQYAIRLARPGTVLNADGGVTVTVATSLPDGVPQANWLPAPEGRFRLGLRVYYPDIERQAAWAPPAVRRIPS